MEHFIKNGDIKIFSKFQWAVPTAFSEAVANCFFTQGDTMYDTAKGYIVWSEALKYIKYDIVVLQASPMPFSFSENWKSKISLILTDYKNNLSKKNHTTTQGRLFTLLWKGDVGVLSEDTPEPKPPVLLQDARQRNVLENILLKFKENNLPEKGFNGKSLFLTACDLTNEVALTNNKTLLYLLEKEFITHTYQFIPDVEDVSIDFQLHPTIYFECFVIDSVNNNKIYEIIKRVFYNPPINANRFLIHEFKQPFTVEKLCEVIRLENYDFLFSSHDNTIERLNELLTITNFYIQIRQRSDNINLSKEMTLLLENTKESWNKKFSQLNTYEQINICRFNRLLLEGVYPAETPKSPKQRFDLNKHGILQTLPAGKE